MAEFVVGLDVGGTGIQYGLFEVLTEAGTLGRRLNQTSVWSGDAQTNHGVEHHVAQIASLIGEAIAVAQQHEGILVGVGVASPGRLRNGIILPGTSPNMGLTNNEFDRVCLQERYILACSQIGIHNISIVVRNDADAMTIGLLEQHAFSPPAFPDQNGEIVNITEQTTIGYFGLGTGLGNSFIRNRRFINDGHLSQIVITIDREDIAVFSKVHLIRGEEMLYFNTEKLGANLESLVCMPTFRALAGLDVGENLNINNPSHQGAIDLVGKYLAKGMIAVHDGDIRDITPDNQWTPEQIENARSTSVYLLGGAVMRDSDVAHRLVTAIDQTLRSKLVDNHGIQAVPMGCDNPAVYAAAQLFMNEFSH
jgi:hypothetical protein